MQRIVFLSFTHRFDDTRVLHKEARALADEGYEVIHIAPYQGRVAPDVVHGVRVLLYESGGGRLGRFVTLLRRALSQRADALHANEMESWVVALLVKLRRPRTRIVFDVHEHYPSRFAEARFPWWLRRIGRPIIRFLFRLLTPLTDHLIFAKRSVAADFHTRPGQASYVFNYARLALPAHDKVRPAIPSVLEKGPVAVHIGDLSRERGWPQLVEALARMRHRDLRVIQLGDFEEGSAPFWAEAERLQVQDRITVRDRVPYDQLFEWLAAADVGLMLYQPGILNHVYAFPMKLYDYMKAGLPVIGPRFAIEVTPVIEAEQCGWLIDTSDPRELAEALDAVCDDRNAARKAGDRGRQAVHREYNWEQQAAQLLGVYQRLLAASGSATNESSVGPVTRDRSTNTSAVRSDP